MLPALASAQTVDTQVQVQSLLSQIQALQLQLKALMASSTVNIKIRMDDHMMAPGQVGKAACIMLNRNLKVGAQGDDVKKIQEILAEHKESGFNAGATGFFGPLTARAMAKFQMNMGIASSSDGVVGPMTRGFFERACGKGLGGGEMMETRGKVRGEITAATASSITVKAENGESRIVNITASTTIQIFATATSTPTTGTVADLTVGKGVAAAGLVNADGSINAIEIKLGMVPPPPMGLMEKIEKVFKFDHRGKMMDN